MLARMKAMEQGGSGVAEVKPTVAESSAAPPPPAAQGEEAAAAAAAAAPVAQSQPQTQTLKRGKAPPPPQTQTLKRGEKKDAASSGGVSGFWAADKWASLGKIGGARREMTGDAGRQASKKPRLGSMMRDSGVLKPFQSWARTWGSIAGGYVVDSEVSGGEKDKVSKAKGVEVVNEKETKVVLKPRPVNALTPRGGGEYDLPHQVMFDTAALRVAEAVDSLQPVGGQSDDLPQQVMFRSATLFSVARRSK